MVTLHCSSRNHLTLCFLVLTLKILTKAQGSCPLRHGAPTPPSSASFPWGRRLCEWCPWVSKNQWLAGRHLPGPQAVAEGGCAVSSPGCCLQPSLQGVCINDPAPGFLLANGAVVPGRALRKHWDKAALTSLTGAWPSLRPLL